MICTFKSVKPNGTVAHTCDRVATTRINTGLVDACNAYWESTTTTYRWEVDSDGVCDMHASTIKSLIEILEEGDFDRIVNKPLERVK